MTNGWDHAKDMSKKHAEANGLFVQLKDDGDKVAGVFCGDPYARECVWVEGEGYEDFDPQAHAGKRPGLRVAINFFDLTDGKMKVFEGGTQWFKGILAVRAKFPLDQWSVEVERHGAARDPKTTYSVLPNAQIDGATRAKIAACPLHDLAAVVRGSSGGEARNEPRAPATATASGPIAADAALRLIERLKQLPKTATDEFMREIGVARIRELPANKQDAAERFLAQLEKAYRQEEVDPFA